ncbi:MAG: carboxypeptidase-like regulatory domain-containing protein [Cyclobacteriaceae bacterium]
MKSELLRLLRMVLTRPFYVFFIILMLMSALVSHNAQSQDKTITGTVTTADDNTGLPGANVFIKGTTTGTVTDVDGNYTIGLPAESEILVFSSVGYITQEIEIGTQSQININLVADVTALEEIVVVGYGTQQKVNLTGAVGVATGEVLEDRPIVNVGEGLQGVVPNLNIDIRNGDPSDTRTDFNIL